MDSNRDNQGLGGSVTGSDVRNYGSSTEGTGQFDDGTRAGSFDRKFAGEDAEGLGASTGGLSGKVDDVKGAIGEKVDGVKGAIGDKVDANRERIGGAVSDGKNRVASQLERISDLVEERARGMEEAGGVQRRASQAALRASEALDSSAQYIRSREPDEMRDDLERQIRANPLLSVGIAAGAGFLLARMLRD